MRQIIIPDGKEIDWEESAKQKKIVFKDKISTFIDVLNKLQGDTDFTESLLSQINAKVKLTQVCHALNDGWYSNGDIKYCLKWDSTTNNIEVCSAPDSNVGRFCFKSRELAEQAIEILDRETLILALYDIW